ncbi:MAG: hypothetical protein AAF491_07270 [Verrucomicrobiota bacterium]
MFQLRVDTGGTFTDCWGLSRENAEPVLAKVLSSGRLRVPVRRWISGDRLVIDTPPSWQTKNAFFTGYKLSSGDETALVLSFEAETGELRISQPLPPSDAVDLFTGEEAPPFSEPASSPAPRWMRNSPLSISALPRHGERMLSWSEKERRLRFSSPKDSRICFS